MLIVCRDTLVGDVEGAFDALELRLDLMQEVDLSEVKRWVVRMTKPVMLTDHQRKDRAWIEQLFHLEPAWIDLRDDVDIEILEYCRLLYPRVKVQISHHSFDEFPSSLESLFLSMKRFRADGYKIAARVFSTNEALQLLLFGRLYDNLSVIPIGEKGSFARVLGPIVGNLWDYAFDQKSLALGQLSVEEMTKIYRYHTLSSRSALYGLIGDPIDASIGHIYHNQLFEKEQRDAVYVKMCLSQDEIQAFLPLAMALGFQGLSITRPLKEAFHTKPVNTWIRTEASLEFANTDAVAAVTLLEERMCELRTEIRGKTIVILGAGGVASAIAEALYAKGGYLVFLNRTIEKAERLAKRYRGSFGRLEETPKHYDILIQCTTQPLKLSSLLPTAIVMELIYSVEHTPLILQAKEQGCYVIHGKKFFIRQADEQRRLWFDRCGVSASGQTRIPCNGSCN